MNYKQINEYFAGIDWMDIDSAWYWQMSNGMKKIECPSKSGMLPSGEGGVGNETRA